MSLHGFPFRSSEFSPLSFITYFHLLKITRSKGKQRPGTRHRAEEERKKKRDQERGQSHVERGLGLCELRLFKAHDWLKVRKKKDEHHLSYYLTELISTGF